MFKLVVLSCLVSVAFAGIISHPVEYAQVKQIVEPHYSVVETPTVSHVGNSVKSIPTAVSHQSQTQYHSKSVVEPIYAHGVEKTYVSTPVVKSVVEQVVPAVKYVQAPVAYAAPAHYAHAAPAHYAHAAPVAYASAPAHVSYAAAPAHVSYASAPAHISYAAAPAHVAYAPKALSYASQHSYSHSAPVAYAAPAHYAHAAPVAYASHYEHAAPVHAW